MEAAYVTTLGPVTFIPGQHGRLLGMLATSHAILVPTFSIASSESVSPRPGASFRQSVLISMRGGFSNYSATLIRSRPDNGP